MAKQLIRFGQNFELDQHTLKLSRAGHSLKLERIPTEILLLLLEMRGEVVTRQQIIERVWGNGVFLDTDNSINGAVRKIRQVLRDDSEDPRFIQTVTGFGYKFIAPVAPSSGESSEAPAAPTSVEAAAALLSAENPVVPDMALTASTDLAAGGNFRVQAHNQRRSWRPTGLMAFVILVTAAVVVYFQTRQPSSPVAAAGRSMLAVLPFENFTGDPAQDYFSDGLTEEMISQLGNLDPAHIGVIARTSVMHYKHTTEPLRQIGNELGVQYVIEGSVRRDVGRVRISAQLIKLEDQSHLWAREYDRDLKDLLSLQTEIAREVGNEIEFSLSGRRNIEAAQAAAPGSGTKFYEAYDLYLKGRYFWNKRTAEGFRQAANYFQQAIDKNPDYGRAYAGLADTFSLMSTWYVGPQNELMPKARAAALRALQLDESLAEAHASLGLIKENYDYDWPGAEREFQRAIQLNPQYATAHQWYAEFLAWQGRFEEAFGESKRAQQLDPLSLIIARDRAMIFYYSRQYESALRECQSGFELNPTDNYARYSMVPIYVQLGRYREAAQLLERWAAQEEGPWTLAWEAVVYSRSGQAENARQAMVKLDRISASNPQRLATSLVAYLGNVDKNRFFEQLQRAYSDHSNAVMNLKVDPIYDPIRSDPRFEDLLRRLELEP